MFCYQCQETAGNSGCTVNGICRKSQEVANLQDLLIYVINKKFYLKIIINKYKESLVKNNY
jgi:hydroxylamine reductase